MPTIRLPTLTIVTMTCVLALATAGGIALTLQSARERERTDPAFLLPAPRTKALVIAESPEARADLLWWRALDPELPEPPEGTAALLELPTGVREWVSFAAASDGTLSPRGSAAALALFAEKTERLGRDPDFRRLAGTREGKRAWAFVRGGRGQPAATVVGIDDADVTVDVIVPEQEFSGIARIPPEIGMAFPSAAFALRSADPATHVTQAADMVGAGGRFILQGLARGILKERFGDADAAITEMERLIEGDAALYVDASGATLDFALEGVATDDARAALLSLHALFRAALPATTVTHERFERGFRADVMRLDPGMVRHDATVDGTWEWEHSWSGESGPALVSGVRARRFVLATSEAAARRLTEGARMMLPLLPGRHIAGGTLTVALAGHVVDVLGLPAYPRATEDIAWSLARDGDRLTLLLSPVSRP